MLTIPEALKTAVDHHLAGNLAEAGDLYRAILGVEPDNVDALNLLGVICHQLGQHDVAIEYHGKAIALRSGVGSFHWNLGLALKAAGRLDEAAATMATAVETEPHAGRWVELGATHHALGRLEAAEESFRQAVAVDPNSTEGWSNLGETLRSLGRLKDAEKCLRRAIAVDPGFADAHYNLAACLSTMGKRDEAIAAFKRTIAIRPDSDRAHLDLGRIYLDLTRFGDAVEHLNRVAELKPDSPSEVHNLLGFALMQSGRDLAAVDAFRRAIALAPDNGVPWGNLTRCLSRLSFTGFDEAWTSELLGLLGHPSVPILAAIGPVFKALSGHPEIAPLLMLARGGHVPATRPYADIAARLSGIPLLLRLMELTWIGHADAEAWLTLTRRHMIMGTEDEDDENDRRGLPFTAALALYCWMTEYVFAEGDDEAAAVAALAEDIGTRLANGQAVPAGRLATLACYRPLHGMPWAGAVLERTWPDELGKVIVRQIAEPLEERALRASIPCLTPVHDSVSNLVREQYEENPYPRWLKPPHRPMGVQSISAILLGLSMNPAHCRDPESPEILVAGCGSGQHSLAVAGRYGNSRVLAVDLSLSSLAYAMRRTRELGVTNIEHAQADILELRSCGRDFDVVECSGVLHHLEDPMAGWRVLTDVLRPGGVMRIALYSERARQSVVAARALIAEWGYSATPQDIRRCRQRILALAAEGHPEMATIGSAFSDFFSLSECRDLIFHVQEHRFTLPRIEAALRDLGLEFLGFEMGNDDAIWRFRREYPRARALTSLSIWNEFERKYPDTFRNMYQFWCRKK